jgi:hypothetical protein
VRHRFIVGIVLSLILMIVAFMVSYKVSEQTWGYVGPVSLNLKNGTLNYISLHTSGWTVLNITCNGRGVLFVKDQLQHKIIFQRTVVAHATFPVELPHEGTYAIFTNGSMFCSGHSYGVYPTSRVQTVLWLSIGILSLVLALLLWRWWR